MSIKEALVRRNQNDVIEIGDVVRKVYNGSFGEILKAYINGRVTGEAIFDQDRSDIPSDRKLGRIEAYTNVLIDIEKMISDMEELKRPLDEDEESLRG